MVISTRNDGEHQSTDQKSLDLYPAPAEPFDEIDGEEISRDVSCNGNNQISDGVPLQHFVFGRPRREADFGQDDGLVEIRAVKGHIEEEPASHRPYEGFEMSPLAEIDEEDIQSRASAGVLNLRPRRIDLGLQLSAIRNDQFHRVLSPLVPAIVRKSAANGIRPLLGVQLPRLEKFLPLRHSETRPQRCKCGDESDADLDAPDGVELAVLRFLVQREGEASENNKGDDGTC